MNTTVQEAATLINHYEVLAREIAKEGPEQLATIAVVQKRFNQPTIDLLKRLIELEKMVPQLIEKIRILEDEANGEAGGTSQADAKTAV